MTDDRRDRLSAAEVQTEALAVVFESLDQLEDAVGEHVGVLGKHVVGLAGVEEVGQLRVGLVGSDHVADASVLQVVDDLEGEPVPRRRRVPLEEGGLLRVPFLS